MAQDINKVGISEEMLDADYFLASIDGKLRRFKKEDLLKALLMKSGGTMAGVIKMDGNAITGLPNAVNDTDALALAFAKTLFAPSGYGLGEVNPVASQDDCKENGFYNPTGKPQTTTYKLNDNFIYQDMRTTNNFGLQSLMTRQFYNGAWGEVEHWNPPMELGVEYRTNIRFDGKAVYVKRTRFVCQNSSLVTFDPGVGSNYKRFVEVVGSIYNDTMQYWFQIPSKYASVSVTPNGFRIESTDLDMNGHIADITIYYAK